MWIPLNCVVQGKAKKNQINDTGLTMEFDNLNTVISQDFTTIWAKLEDKFVRKFSNHVTMIRHSNGFSQFIVLHEI